MKIIFFGSSKFAVPSLLKLHTSKHSIAAVVTQPDKRKGRGLRLSCTPVKDAARDLKIFIYQPESLNAPAELESLKSLLADIFVVIAYGKILPKSVLDIPRIMPVNLHASLLPRYRGAAPVQRAIINGDVETGVTIIRMNEKMDAGDMLLQKKIPIDKKDTASTLEERLSEEGTKAILECLDKIENGDCTPISQDETKVVLAPKLTKNDGQINWSKPAPDIINLIRGCYPWPGAFTYYKGKLLKIYAAGVTQSPTHPLTHSPGEILSTDKKEGILISTGKDALLIEDLQPEGKRRMNAQEFIAGHKIKTGELLG